MFQQKLRQFAKLGLLGTASFSVIAFYRGEPKFYSNVSCSQEITILLGLILCFESRVFLRRQIWIVNYYVKNPIKDSQ